MATPLLPRAVFAPHARQVVRSVKAEVLKTPICKIPCLDLERGNTRAEPLLFRGEKSTAALSRPQGRKERERRTSPHNSLETWILNASSTT